MAPLSYTCQDIITDALIEIGALAPGDVSNLDGDEAQWAFRKLNLLTDEWAALEKYVYSYGFNLFTLIAGLSPHTIGPAPFGPNAWTAPTFSTGISPRPVKIESAAQIQNSGTTAVDLLITIRDKDWWAARQVKAIQTNVVTDLYYDPTSPLGSLYFWPVPNAGAQVRLQYWQTVSQFQAITDPIGGPGGPGTLPVGYRNAIMLTLAEMLLPGENRAGHEELHRSATRARAAIFGNNNKSPRIATRDYGMPKGGGGGKRGDFNWITGGPAGGRPE